MGEIFRKYGEKYIEVYKPDLHQINLIKNIRKCRTPAMGGVMLTCKGCGEQKYIYKSCGDSKCPVCQGIKRMQCQDRISKRMLNVPYVHITFTLPHELNSILKSNPKVLYSLLYQSAWATIKEVCKDPKNVGGLPGMIAILHTWGSDMKYHVHLHTLVTFGGLDEEGNWHYPQRKDRIAGYREMKRVFRKHYLAGLKKLWSKGELKEVPMMEELIKDVEEKAWCIHNTKPQINTENIEEYLSRYIMRIAVSNSRLELKKTDEMSEEELEKLKKGKIEISLAAAKEIVILTYKNPDRNGLSLN